MAATLAGVCQVPLTSVLLLFELTQDYRIVLPLLGAVGLSSWITSSQNRKRDTGEKLSKVKGVSDQQPKDLLSQNQESTNSPVSIEVSGTSDLCELESSLCVYDSGNNMSNIAARLTVSQSMKTRYVTVLMSTSIVEAVTLMLVEKQSCAMIIDSNNFLVGLLALEVIQDFSRVARASDMEIEVDKILVSDICQLEANKCQIWTATPDMTVLTAERIMDSHGVNQLPVVSEHTNNHARGNLIGLLDRECISIVCRAVATKESLSPSSMMRGPESSL